jgi:hypothetical protein
MPARCRSRSRCSTGGFPRTATNRSPTIAAGVLDRQREDEPAAAAALTLHPDPPAVQLDEAFESARRVRAPCPQRRWRSPSPRSQPQAPQAIPVCKSTVACAMTPRASGTPGPVACFQNGRLRMEPLWSPVIATGDNQWQIRSARKRRKQAKTLAVGCGLLPEGPHGKEGGRRFESVRGLCKIAGNRTFLVQAG